MFWFTDTTEKLEVGEGTDHFRMIRKDYLFGFGSQPQNNEGKKPASDSIK